ncbi:MAG: type III pantothenate kinase [Xanthomonadales bacterium]|nr:type III pantothenate kinase [Xanthomonadales bacterium]
MNLLLDLGNSRLKWALDIDGELQLGSALDWHAPDFDAALRACWGDLPQPARLLGANVTSAARQQRIEQALASHFDQPPQWLRSPATRAGLRNAYTLPQHLGIDRFLSLLAAHAEGHAPCVIAGCGSALTLDALAPQGRHLGGLIMPGVKAMQLGLQQAVPGLPTAPGSRSVAWAINTHDAVASGPWQAAAGAIARFQHQLAAHLGSAPTLLLSGGDAPTLVEVLGSQAQRFDHAVLRGLQVWARSDSS